MQNKNFQNFTKIFFIFLIVFGIFFFAHASRALSLLDFAGDPTNAIIDLINRVMIVILEGLGKIIETLGKTLAVFLHPSIVTQNQTVVTGWIIVRDVANMFFLFIIIIIALGTILGIGDYGIKLLPRLIAMAILINFTRLIVGLVIDFSNVFAEFFIKNSGGADAIGPALANGLNIAKVFQGQGDIKGIIGASGAAFASLLMGEIVLLVTAFTMLAVMLLFLFRNIALWGVTIVAPMVFLASIVPQTSDYIKKWWQFLFKWSFFAPVYTFFLYLAIGLIKANVIPDSFKNAANVEGFLTAIAQPGPFATFLFVVAIMLGGLWAATTLGIYGANTTSKYGKSAAAGIAGYVGKTAARGRAGKYLEKGGELASKYVPAWLGGSYLGTALSRSGLSALRAREAVEKESEKWDKLTAKERLENFGTSFGERKDAIARSLIKTGDLNDIDIEQARVMKQRLEAVGYKNVERDLFKYRPDLAPGMAGIKDEDLAGRKPILDREIKKLTAEDYQKINSRALEKPDVTESLVRNADDEKSLNAIFKATFNIKDESKQTQSKQTQIIEQQLVPQITAVAQEKPFVADWMNKNRFGVFPVAPAKKEEGPSIIAPGTETEFKKARATQPPKIFG